MGISSSRPELPEGFEFPPPPRNRDELRERYGYEIFSASGFTSDCSLRLEAVFNVFCTCSESIKFWSEPNLADFLQSTFPPELAPALLDAIPILHRFLLRLGSFPYQNDPDKLLTLNVLRMAVILLLKNDAYRWSTDQEGRVSNSDPWFDKFRVVVFQSMTSLENLSESSPDPKRQRGEEDDLHLQEVLDCINSSNYWRDPEYPKWVVDGPKYPVSLYSSSWSKDLHRLIPMDEFRSLLRLLVVSQLYRGGIDVQQSLTCLPRLENITDCMIAAFKEENDTSGIPWEVFDQVVGRSMPRLLKGWARLLGPAYSTKYLDNFDPSASVPEAQTLLRKTFIPLFQQEGPIPGQISNLPILSQLAILMPDTLQTETASICWSVSAQQQLSSNDLHGTLTAQPPHPILLISGRHGNTRLIFGALLTRPSSSSSTMEKESQQLMVNRMVQLEPVHRSFCPRMKDSAYPLLLHKNHTATLVKITVDTGDSGIVDLVLDETSRRGQLAVRNDSRLEQKFCIDAVEILRVDKGKRRVFFN